MATAVEDSAAELLLRAAALVPLERYALAALVLAAAFLYRFLELHVLGDLLRGLRGGRVALTFHPDSQVYHRVAAKCRSLHGRYLATPWLASPHLQTLFLGIWGIPPSVTYRRQLYTVRDGGTIALDWLLASDREAADGSSCDGTISSDDSTPIVVVVPGLTSDSTAAYVKHLVFSMVSNGWNVVVGNHRGLGGISITSDCFYNGGWTEDIREVVNYLHQKYPEAPLFTVGTSLGANILVKYLGEEGESTPVAGAASICSPWDLLVTSRFISRKLVQRCYDKALAIGLKGYAKLHQPVLARLANWEAITSSCSTREFDHHATCVVAKYETVDTFYRKCSCANYIGNVSVPLLCISALDDPLCTREAIPWDECRANKNIVLATTPNGGHLGFFQGLTAGRLWWVKPVSEFFSALHDSPCMHRQKIQEHGLQSSMESSIDKGPYVNLMEDGMVAAVTNEDTNIHDSLDKRTVSEMEGSDGMINVQQNGSTSVLQDESHSAVKNTNSSEDNVAPAQGLVGSQEQREELSTDKIRDAIAPVKKSINQLIRSQGRSVWWLAYIAVVTSWPLLGALGFFLYRKKFRNSLPAKRLLRG
ncbi:embryogenesis-associated protein EMB8-like isoform X1 [Triticum dicoccoides]|uniref:embryogenesis-associated protein EMB8-like isoform X1 n=1 Tax=Triticum dicoccoides TaxID=85692 RepID=UPI00188F33C2|nr:embryogenesis-associated protein EMB8-like isoform X1 [Triticum dicoccoides]